MTAFFDADLFRFGTFDLTARRETLVAEHSQGFYFRALARLLAVFQHFEVAWARHAIFINHFFTLGHRTPKYQKFADVLNWRGIEFVSQSLEHGLSRCAVIRKYADLDQSVRVQGGIGFFLDSVSETVSPHHDHGVQVVGVGAVFFALSRGQLNLGHADIIG